MAVVRPGQPKPRRRPWFFQRLDLQERWNFGRFGRAGGSPAAAPRHDGLVWAAVEVSELCTTIPGAHATSAINGLVPGQYADIVGVASFRRSGFVHEVRH